MASERKSPVRRHAPPGRPRRGEREPLSRTRIVEEALRLIDAGGIDALSMRALAQRLDVEAMTLYAHVESKDALLDAVADRVASELILPTTSANDWQARIRNAVVAWARMEEAHPGAFPLLYRPRFATEVERALNEELMNALAAAGFSPPDVALAYQTLVAFLDGALLQWPRSRWQSRQNWAWVEINVDAERHPRLVETARHAQAFTWEQVFFTGLDLFLGGLAARLETVRRGASHAVPIDQPGDRRRAGAVPRNR